MSVLQQPSKPLAHSRALVACAAVAVNLVVPMASPPPPTSAPAPGSVGWRPPAPPIPEPRAPPQPAYDWAKLAQRGSGPVPVLTGQVVIPRGSVASALAELRGNKAETFEVPHPSAPAEERTRKKLSELPLLQVPTALAVGTAVAATAGFEQTKGLASLFALVVLFGTSLQVMHARICTTRNLM